MKTDQVSHALNQLRLQGFLDITERKWLMFCSPAPKDLYRNHPWDFMRIEIWHEPSLLTTRRNTPQTQTEFPLSTLETHIRTLPLLPLELCMLLPRKLELYSQIEGKGEIARSSRIALPLLGAIGFEAGIRPGGLFPDWELYRYAPGKKPEVYTTAAA